MNKKKWRIDTPIQKVETVKSADSDSEVVVIKGYASTFEEDRDGDTVDSKAFEKTVDKFMQNPVILTDHRNEVQHVVGKAIKVEADKKGLGIEVQLSNSPDEYTSMVRTKVREGLLRAFSIGGMFGYEGNQIKEVDLMEVSIVGVPANQSSLFQVAKSMDLSDQDKEQEEVSAVEAEPEKTDEVAPDEKTTDQDPEPEPDESIDAIKAAFVNKLTKLYKGVS